MDAESQCQTDADCESDEACLCKSGFPVEGGFEEVSSETSCRPADCRTDADCAEGYLCGIAGLNDGTGLLELHCHSDADDCQTPADCYDGEDWPKNCSWDSSAGRWRCRPVGVN